MNTNFRLASLLARSLWAIDERHAVNRLPLVAAILEGKSNVNFPKLESDPVSLVASAQAGASSEPKPMKIGVVTIKGELVKDGDWCVYGMQDYGAKIQKLDADPEICGIILKVDSPGGTVDGTYAFAELIRGTTKPIVVYSDGMIASGAYWISAASDYIISENKTCEVGSIGVMLSFADFQPYYEKKNVKFHILFADQSPDKWRMFNDLRDGKYKEYKETVLNPLAAEFISKVQAFRSGIDKKALTGEVYFADKAVEMGLIDEIGTFDRAVEKVLELVEKSESNSLTNTSKTMSKEKSYTRLSAILGADHTYGDDGSHLAPEQLEAVETALAAHADSATELAALRETNATQAAEAESLRAAIAERDTQIANLQNAAATEPATDTSDAEPEAGEETLETYAAKNPEDIAGIVSRWKEERGLK